MSTVHGGQGRIITDGLVLRLDAANPRSYTTGRTVWNDLSGNGNNGTLTNGPTFNSSNGGSIQFDGTNQYVLANYIIPASSTVILWFKQSSLLSKGILETTTGGVGSGTPNLYVNANTGTLRTYSVNGSPQYSDISTYLANTWYCLAITRTSTSETTYFNGVIRLSNKTLSWSSNSQLNIGVGFAGYFNGNISNIQIYNRALSASEVLQNYNATRARFGV